MLSGHIRKRKHGLLLSFQQLIFGFDVLEEDILSTKGLVCVASGHLEGLAIDLLGVQVHHLRTRGVILVFQESLEFLKLRERVLLHLFFLI